MTHIFRQKTGATDAGCVALLCMATTTLLGFSTTQTPSVAAEPVIVAKLTTAEPVVEAFITPHAPAPITPLVAMPANPVKAPAQRPSSLADSDRLNPVLADIPSRIWLMPSVYSPDRVIADQRSSQVGKFHGVGFPDIRTYPRARRSPFAAPDKWARMVSWRTSKDEQSVTEPIARVRCMGLTPQAVARRADRYREMIYAYSDRYDVSPHLVKAVITEESCFNNKALSPAGAQGLMQLMPDTASWLKVKDPHDPAQNLRAGVRYLASLQKQFDTLELALAAYNAGPGNVRRYKGVPPFAETQAYVVKVQAHYRRYKAANTLLNPVEEVFEQASNGVSEPIAHP